MDPIESKKRGIYIRLRDRDGFPREGILELSLRATVGAGQVDLQLGILNTGASVYEGPGMRNALKPPESWMQFFVPQI